MNKALDENKVEIFASNSVEGTVYTCPFCGNKLFRKHNNSIWYFSHYKNESCIDYSELDNTEWANNFKNQFEAKDTDFVVDIEHQKHLVDVNVKNRLAIMFSSKRIHREIFEERSENALYQFPKLMWVFEMKSLIADGKMFADDYKNLVWRIPYKLFEGYSYGDEVTIVAELYNPKDEKEIVYAVFDEPQNIYDDRLIKVRRWLTKDQFNKYFNDIGNGLNPEAPYLEQERIEREREAEYQRKLAEQEEQKRKAQQEAERLLELQRQAAEERRKKLEAEKEQRRKEKVQPSQKFMTVSGGQTIEELYKQRQPKRQFIVTAKRNVL